MRQFEILFNPRYQMVFERSLDDLMEEITQQQLVDVGSREIICERLNKRTRVKSNKSV